MASRFTILTIAFLGLVAGAHVHAQQGPDELWETTMAMESDGMKMPAMTQSVCSPKGARQEQRMMDKNCRTLESKQVGKKFTFKFACEEGADKWTGTGEMEDLGANAYRGKMAASGVREGQPFKMNMEMSGKKIGGCTYEDPRKKADEMMAQHSAMLAKECDKMIAELEPTMFFGMEGLPPDALICKDRKTEFCANVTKVTAGMREPKGFLAVQEKYGDKWRAASQACGTDPAKISAPVCTNAVSTKDWSFVGSHCPTEAASLRKENCLGRTYTSVAPAARDLCAALGGLSYTASAPSSAKAAPQPGEAPAEGVGDKLKKGAEKLKKFLKF
jgi:hypothetical protein